MSWAWSCLFPHAVQLAHSFCPDMASLGAQSFKMNIWETDACLTNLQKLHLRGVLKKANWLSWSWQCLALPPRCTLALAETRMSVSVYLDMSVESLLSMLPCRGAPSFTQLLKVFLKCLCSLARGTHFQNQPYQSSNLICRCFTVVGTSCQKSYFSSLLMRCLDSSTKGMWFQKL